MVRDHTDSPDQAEALFLSTKKKKSRQVAEPTRMEQWMCSRI
jgi:hypothetical protein